MPVKHVCILGCGRSGTSIFGELFQSIPAYRYYSEPSWDEFSAIDFSRPVAVKVPRTITEGTPTPGLPFRLDEFLAVFPSSGVLFWQVRHPLETICSLRVGISKNWGHHPQPQDYRDWTDRPLIEQCAYHWYYINTRGYKSVEKLVHVNRFEDMVKDPLATAKHSLHLAGVSFEDCLSAVQKWADRVQDKNNEKFIEAECSKPYSRQDHSRKVGRWQENLTTSEIASTMPILGDAADQFGYKLNNQL